tara:strand:+ start:336 stop:1028 length:693 start_codon:yes stop_codon:yes gene_type:complete
MQNVATHLKKNICILFLGLIMSCNSNRKLEGTWIGAYSYSENVDSSMSLPLRTLVTFENDKYFAKNFKYDYRSERDYEKGTYKFKWNKIFHNSDNEFAYEVAIINTDSLVLKGNNGSNNAVLKKLNDSLKNQSKNVKLVGKRFLSKSVKNTDLNKVAYDTLSFVNDSILIKKSDKTRNPGTRWERFKQNGFDIIFMEMEIPLIIRNKDKNKIYLTGFHKKRYEIELTELK